VAIATVHQSMTHSDAAAKAGSLSEALVPAPRRVSVRVTGGWRPAGGTVVRPRGEWSLLDPDLLRWQAEVHGSDAAFLRQLAEVRAIVEPAGARLAARRRSRGELAELDHALAAMADAGRAGDAVVDADLRFHRALLVAAHNDLMLPMEAVIEAGLRARDRLVHDAACADPIPMHRKVVAAVRSRDPAAAEAAMRDLLAHAERDVRRAIRHRQRDGGERT